MKLTTTTDKLIDSIINSDSEVFIEETNEWVDGMYIRTLILPKNIVVVGHIHKKATINILTKGVLLIRNATDKDWTRIEAPYTIVTPPGTQKIALALEDSVFINIIRTDKTTIEETYEDVVVPDKRAIIYHQYKALEGVIE